MGVKSAKDLPALMLQLEGEFSIVTSDDGSSFIIGPKAPSALKFAQVMKAWAGKGKELVFGELSEDEYEEWKSRF